MITGQYCRPTSMCINSMTLFLTHFLPLRWIIRGWNSLLFDSNACTKLTDPSDRVCVCVNCEFIDSNQTHVLKNKEYVYNEIIIRCWPCWMTGVIRLESDFRNQNWNQYKYSKFKYSWNDKRLNCNQKEGGW